MKQNREKDEAGEPDYEKSLKFSSDKAQTRNDRGTIPVRQLVAKPKIIQDPRIQTLTQRWASESTAVKGEKSLISDTLAIETG